MHVSNLRLFITTPGVAERVYDLVEGEAIFGRDESVTIPVADRTLSRKHCRMYMGADGWRVTDLGSKNGTFLNGAVILDERVRSGDSVEIGETRIAVHDIETTGAGADIRAHEHSARLSIEKPVPPGRAEAAHHREIRALNHLMTLNEKINALDSEDRLLDGILDAAIELTEAARGFLLIRQEDHFVVRRARLPDHRDMADAEGNFSVSVATEVIRSGNAMLSEDLQHDPRFEGSGSVANLDLRSLVCVPLRSSKEVFGAVYLDNSYAEGTFDGWDVRMLEGFASLASIAIRNARQRKDMAKHRREAVRQARRIERLNERLRKALKVRTDALRRAREDLAKQADQFGLRYRYENVIGRSPAMQAVLRTVDRITDLTIPVMIIGESGTGKELIARAMHFNSDRRGERLVSENCAAIPAALVESEFFGHKKGAFTGADRDHVGLFEQAHAGTLFLDEVGEMPAELQKKFLRVLEEGSVRRLGSKRLRSIDVRLISATNRNIGSMLQNGQFREDLYYRIAGVVIELPPLRERRQDIPALVAHFLASEGEEASRITIDRATMDLLVAFDWPGNVRELRNEVQRLVAVQRAGVVQPAHLSARILNYEPSDPDDVPEGGLKTMVEDLERRVLRAALTRHEWNKSRTARELGLSRLGLRKKIERYGIDSEEPPKGVNV